ncbi:MAG: AzlD domain-containing protein [Anaerolineales bacterium]|nr:MAG: AzlD domain-containing protein [Anaerolineales bacterium]
MNIWLTIILSGLATFGMRFSFVWLMGRYEVPAAMRRALHYVPIAVLSAIIFPGLFLPEGQFDLSLGNTRLLAGLVAIAVAAWTKNSLLTIVAGFAALLVLEFVGAR